MRFNPFVFLVLTLHSLLSAADVSLVSTGEGTGYPISSTANLYRNIARNPLDINDSLWKLSLTKQYPHASSNSECRKEPVFLARCAINDTIRNTGHGAGFPSWGPEQVTDAWLKIDFGKPMAVDSITIYIRADFPHDGYWCLARLNFSDSSRVNIALDSTAQPQGFKFSRRKTNWVRIDNLVWHVPNTWCAFSEVQIWGNDSVPAQTLTGGRGWHDVPVQTGGESTFSGKYYLLNGKKISKPVINAMHPTGVRITRSLRNQIIYLIKR